VLTSVVVTFSLGRSVVSHTRDTHLAFQLSTNCSKKLPRRTSML